MDQSEPIPVSDQPVADQRDRRMFLTAGIGAIAAAALNGIVNPHVASAASVVLGGTNSATRNTIIRNTKASSTAKGVVGRTTYTGAALNAAGVQGIADGTNASGVWGIANKGPNAAGVYGASTTGTGVVGYGPDGVYGEGVVGVMGSSGILDGAGVLGIAGDACLDGVVALSETEDGNGLYCEASTGANAAGIYAASATGYAGFFDGPVTTTDGFYSPAALLQVDHPDDPANRWYRQALVGSFERISVLSGNAVTGPNGRVSVKVPAIFGQTHRDIRYQLTPIGRSAATFVARELDGGRFVIDAGAEGVRVSWQLTGERSDPSARRHVVEVEARKRAGERGRYLEPALYHQPAARGLRRRGPTVRSASRRHNTRRDPSAEG